jgi:hypothetical protein
MADGFSVDVQEIRAHAARLEALRQRFGAVTSASASIGSNDEAYGVLCGWLAGVLERRHQRQNQLFGYVEENLGLAAAALVRTGQDYADIDAAAADRIHRARQS